MKKWVVLEHLGGPHKGFRFFSMNVEGNDSTKSMWGDTWYKLILETDDMKEAQKVCMSLTDAARFLVEYANLVKG